MSLRAEASLLLVGLAITTAALFYHERRPAGQPRRHDWLIIVCGDARDTVYAPDGFRTWQNGTLFFGTDCRLPSQWSAVLWCNGDTATTLERERAAVRLAKIKAFEACAREAKP